MRRRAACLTDIRKIEIREAQLADPGEKEVLIRVKAVGICGSDISYYTRGSTGLGRLEFPHILGHECAGEVIKTGREVPGLSPGDRVAVEPGAGCGVCEYCRTGRYNLCENMAFMSSAVKRPGGEGGMAELVIRPAQYVYRIPDGVSYEQAALLEPISVAIHAMNRSGIRPGQCAAVLGCGPIGGCLLLVLRACGISRIYMTDIDGARAERMKVLGASETYTVKDMGTERLKRLLPEEADVVFDTTCQEDACNAGLHWMKKGGILTMVGVPSGHLRIDLQTLFVREQSIITTFRYANTYPAAIRLTESGRLHPEVLISHRYSFADVGKAMEKAASRERDVMKVMIEV